MATNNSLQLFVSKVLPARTTYSKERNMFLANAYTSAAGNTYFQGIRLSERIKIKYDFGVSIRLTTVHPFRLIQRT